jgi:general L-amino acid transport system ATP-binding protein
VAENAAAGNAPIIEMRGVNKWFGQFHVLKDIDLTVRKGERVVVCGPSGSGKSTLIRCINRLEQHDEGAIVVDGIELDEDTKNVAAIRREVGMVFQQFNLFPHRTVLENCALPQIRARAYPRGSRSESHGYLTRVRIPEQARKPGAAVRWTTAARGDRAVALHGAEDHAVRRADVGPRSGNDQGSARRDDRPGPVRDDDDLRNARDGFARKVADIMVFMDSGRIVERSPPAEFFAAPRSERTKLFLSQILTH